jgi:O-glycosyl hydrolase
VFNAGKKLWMTETSGTGSDWAGALESANSVFAALRYGKLAGWVWWYGADDLVTTTALTKKGHALKHFYRYIRPGAVMYDITDASASNLFVAAFAHAAERTMTVIAINMGGAQTMNITGTGLPTQFQKYQSTSGDNCRDMGTTTTTVSLAGNSITTLYATNFSVGVDRPAMSVEVQKAPRTAANSRTFDLRGRTVAEAGAVMGTAGAYYRTADGSDRGMVRAEIMLR